MATVDRMAFFSALGNMLSVGIPMLRAVRSLQEQFVDPLSRAVMEALAHDLARGRALSAAMAALPRTFTRLQIGAINGAEQSGHLTLVLHRLHRYDERTLSLTRQLKSVLTYPAVVFACAIALVLFIGRSLLTGMIPALAQARVEMSASTRLVLALARLLDQPLAVAIIVGAAALGLWQLLRWLATAHGQAFRDRAMLRAPLLGAPLRKVETTRICEALATMYGGGLTMLACLEVMREATPNVVAREAVGAICVDLREGRALSEAMRRSGFFEKTVVQLVMVGEESGRLEAAFEKIAQYNELEVRTALDQLAAALEPLMFVGLGTLVGIIALVAFTPIYQLMNAL
jgi:type II secretory pathway component PulF